MYSLQCVLQGAAFIVWAGVHWRGDVSGDRRLNRELCAIALVFVTQTVAAGFACGDEITLQTNLYNIHYHYDPDHIPYSPLVAAEWRRNDGWLIGGGVFLNSFGQFSQTVYGGYLWNIADTGFYAKLVGGAVHGYTGQYKDKLPLNVGGFAPGIIPAIGYKLGPVRIETQFIWTSGLMITGGIAF
jgi:hypothetical protein